MIEFSSHRTNVWLINHCVHNDMTINGRPLKAAALTIQSVVLFVAAFAQDGGRAVVEDGGGLYGGQAACRDGASVSWRVRFGWAGVCF